MKPSFELHTALLFDQTIIAFDCGRSTTKVIALCRGKTTTVVFPSIVAPLPRFITSNTIRMLRHETVEVNGKKYLGGESARLYTDAFCTVGLSYDYFENPEFAALIRVG